LPTSKILYEKVSAGLGSSAKALSSFFQYYELLLFAFPIAILMSIAVMILIRFTASCFVFILILLAVGGLVGFGAYLLSQNGNEESLLIKH